VEEITLLAVQRMTAGLQQLMRRKQARDRMNAVHEAVSKTLAVPY